MTAYATGLASCLRAIALAQPSNRLAVFQNMANDAGGYVRKGGIVCTVIEAPCV